MNISEVKNLVQGASYEGKIEVLEDIFQRSGDCIENGYLGSSVSSISYDEFGRLEFQSEHFENGIIVISSGAVLDDSVIIMQVQENDNSKLLSLYSWKKDGSNYTYLALDSLSALEKAYIEIKKQNKGFLAANLDEDILDIGLSYRDIMNVKVAVGVQNQSKEQVNECVQADVLTSFSV